MWSISALRVMSLGQTMISKVIIKKIYKWLSLKNHHTGSTALISTLLLKTPICEVWPPRSILHPKDSTNLA